MLTKYKAVLDRKLERVARGIASLGLTPNQLTVLGLLLALASCAILLWTRHILLFSFLIILFGLVDAVDGLVARVTQKTSKFGSYLDALCDRYFEGAVLFSVACVTGYWALTFLVCSGALLTSYAKARAAMEVSVSNTEWPDFMERTERCVVFIAGLILSELFRVQWWGHDLFYWTLVFLAAATHLTAVQRLFRAKRIIEQRGG